MAVSGNRSRHIDRPTDGPDTRYGRDMDRVNTGPNRRRSARRRDGEAMTRRRFLGTTLRLSGGVAGLGALGGLSTSVLAACSQAQPPDLVALFSPDRVLVAGMEQRVPFAVITPPDGAGSVALPGDDEAITVRLLQDDEVIDEVEVTGHVIDHDHSEGTEPDHEHADLYRYYPARLTMPEPGVYDLVTRIGGTQATMPVQAFYPDEVLVPLPGSPMPVVDTPTFDRPGDIDQLCTRFEPCPFHEENLADVMAAGRPAALLVATPAFCQTAYCGPVVDTLIEAGAAVPSVTCVHAEVYANPNEVGGDYTDPDIRLAPAVEAIGLPFEPSLFLIDASGNLVDRIDNVFDLSEATEALARLA